MENFVEDYRKSLREVAPRWLIGATVMFLVVYIVSGDYDAAARVAVAFIIILFVGMAVRRIVISNSLPSWLETGTEIEEARERIRANPDNVKNAWDLATAKLEAYLSLNLSQINWIFRTSLIVMLVGFIFLVIATLLALQDPEAITPVVVAGVGGVITEFIGATFLVLYRSAVEHSANYISTLDKTSSVGVAIQILDSISSEASEETNLKIIEAKIEVAKLLLQLSAET